MKNLPALRYFKNIIWTFVLLMFSATYGDSTFHLNFEEGDLPSLRPQVLQGHARGRVLALLLYEGLTNVDASGNVSFKHAKNISISEDELTYVIELHSRHWSDGTPVFANDYERAWKEAVAPEASSDYDDLIFVLKNAEAAKRGKISPDQVGVKALDETTLKVELEYPAPYFLKLLAQPLFLPTAQKVSVVNGPFVVSEYQKGNFLNLKKNPNFWNSKEIALSEISIYFITDAKLALEMYEAEKLDFLGEPVSRLSNEALPLFQTRVELKAFYPSRFFGLFLIPKNRLLTMH